MPIIAEETLDKRSESANTSLGSYYPFHTNDCYYNVRNFLQANTAKWAAQEALVRYRKVADPMVIVAVGVNRNLLESDIDKCIKNSAHILDKRDDWDEEGAIGCSALIYARATNLLRFYSVEIKKQYKIAIEVPEINLARDGSIDLEWRTDKVIFLMNVLNQASYEVHYYGEDLESNTIIKGIIKNSILNNDLVFWMKKLNKYG